MKDFFKHPVVIGILIIIAVIFIGNYLGWFKSPCIGCGNPRPDTNGFPATPQIGDKFTKDGVVYVYKKMDIQCIQAPCYDAMWVPLTSGDSHVNRSNNGESNPHSTSRGTITECLKYTLTDLSSPQNNYLIVVSSKDEKCNGMKDVDKFIGDAWHYIKQTKADPKQRMIQLQSQFSSKYPNWILKTTINPITVQ